MNPHGWGCSYYPSNRDSCVLFKEPIPGNCSELVKFLYTYQEMRSKTFIGHIRLASPIAGVSYQNTHPFLKSYRGKDFCFAHNGILHKRERLEGLTYTPIDETDSELAFCYLLSMMDKNDIRPENAGELCKYEELYFKFVYETLLDINIKTKGAFNCIFSDGRYLFCYRDIQEARYLFYQQVENRNEILDTPQNFTTKKSYIETPRVERGVVVATEPMNDGPWKSFNAGNLILQRHLV